jgi:ABC-2 type transport system permease protein
MNHSSDESSPAGHPIYHLTVARILEFLRQPDAVFWSYFFPVLMVVALGLAFNRRQEPVVVLDVVDKQLYSSIQQSLKTQPRFNIHSSTDAEARIRLRTGRTDLLIDRRADGPGYVYIFDSMRPESAAAKSLVDDCLQRSAGRQDSVMVSDQAISDPGSRYVDFLVPGILGMNIMGGGLWGVGFAVVQMRIRKLLKRLVSTPMKKSHFLWSVLASRLVFLIPSVIIILGFSWLTFGVGVRGSLVSVLVVILLGSLTFSGIGLLVACRANSVEMVSGLMNLVMLPMWLFSGIFFSTDRFPDAMQPFVQALPLTPLIAALRAITLEGAGLFEPDQLLRLAILAAWAGISFCVALKAFRWT